MVGFVDVGIVAFVFMTISIFALAAEVITKRKENSELEMEVEQHRALKQKRRESYFRLRETMSNRLEDYLSTGEINPTVYRYVMSKLSDGGFVFMADLHASELMELKDGTDEMYQKLLEEYTEGEEQ